MYIKINGSDTTYDAIVKPFKTSNGYKAVKIVSDVEIPVIQNGFKFYIDDNNFVDYSDYIYLYKSNQYSVTQDTPSTGKANNDPIPPNIFDKLSNQVSIIANQTAASISEINDAICELSTDVDERVGVVEDALCELSEGEEEI